MLQLKDITKTYGEKENAVVALKGISLVVMLSVAETSQNGEVFRLSTESEVQL